MPTKRTILRYLVPLSLLAAIPVLVAANRWLMYYHAQRLNRQVLDASEQSVFGRHYTEWSRLRRELIRNRATPDGTA